MENPPQSKPIEYPSEDGSVRAVAEPGALNHAQLKFLSIFLNGAGGPADYDLIWAEALNVNPSKLLAFMVGAGLLDPTSLAWKLNRALTAAEVKAMLRELGLAVSGKKADCVARLIAADHAGMEARVSFMTTYICSDTGRKQAEAYLRMEEENRRSAQTRSLEFLCAGKLHDARLAVSEYERRQIFKRGVNVDWHLPPSHEDICRLRAILDARPSILKDVTAQGWDTLQKAAAMMHLWGEHSGLAWLPAGFVGASNHHPNTAVRMVMLAGMHQADLRQYRELGNIDVAISPCGEDSCPACKGIGGRKYHVSLVPELPYPACTSDMGCRCVALPAFD